MKTHLSIASLALSLALVACKKSEEAPTKAPPAEAPKAVKAAEPEAPVAVAVAAKAPACPEGMAALPAGSFESKQRRQRGQQANVEAFCLDRREVSVADYEACVEKGDCEVPDADDWNDGCNWRYSDPPGFSRKNHPVNCIDAVSAGAYCKSLGKRLPSADEFEWAQRGGPAGTVFPWGDDREARRVCSTENKNPGDVPRMTTACATGSCPAGDSPQGIHDLSSGLSEWTSTSTPDGWRWYCGGSTSCEQGSVNEVKSTHEAGWCLETEPDSLNYEGIGFRCAQAVPQ